MAGASVQLSYKINDANVVAALERMEALGADPSPVFEDFGEYWLNSHQERWADAKDPVTGESWAPLSEAYKARKTKNADRILVWRGQLRDTLNYQVDGASLGLGTPSIYGATQMFGAPKGSFGTDKHGRPLPWGDIPARAYLGMSAADAAELRATVLFHAENALAG